MTPRSLLSAFKPSQVSHGDDGRMDALWKEKLKKFKNRTVNRVVNCWESLPRYPHLLANRAVMTESPAGFSSCPQSFEATKQKELIDPSEVSYCFLLYLRDLMIHKEERRR